MTVVERALCALGLHAWLRVEGAGRVSAVCARNASHRRLLEIPPLEKLPLSVETSTRASAVESVYATLRDEEARASVALDGETQTCAPEVVLPAPSADIPADKIAASEAAIESGQATIPVDIPATAEPLVFPAGRRGGPSKVPCSDGYKLHKWAGPDADGWLRCLRGCGAGRSHADAAERVWPPESVPALASTVVEPPPAIIELPKFDKSTISHDADDFGDFGEPAAVSAVPEPGEENERVQEDLDDDDEIVGPRGPTIPREQLALLAGRDAPRRALSVRAPCPKCGTGQLVRDPLERDDQAYACITCGYRPPLSAEQAVKLAKEFEVVPGSRRRQPSYNGQKL